MSRSGCILNGRLPKIDNARPFGDRELTRNFVTTVNDIQNMCPVDEIAAIRA
jgi:hypothetical protein